MPHAPSLFTRTLRQSSAALTELRCDRRNFGCSAPMPRDDAYLIGLQLRDCADHDLYFDGRIRQPVNFRSGVTTIYDLRQQPVAECRDPFHSLMFYLPRSALDEFARETGRSRFDELIYPPAAGLEDPVVRHLLLSLLPALARPREASAMFIEHVASALTTHVARAYGGVAERPPRHGLTYRQERLAKDLLAASLAMNVSVQELADACGLSVRQFSRAFRRTTGMPPHRWLLHHRVGRAQQLLADRSRSTADIAIECGFADQSHFTRVFKAIRGVTPVAWRNASP